MKKIETKRRHAKNDKTKLLGHTMMKNSLEDMTITRYLRKKERVNNLNA